MKSVEYWYYYLRITAWPNEFCLDECRPNLFKDDSRGNAVVPMNGSRNGAREIFDGGHKIKSVKIVSTNKGKVTESDAICNHRSLECKFFYQRL
jgi:hypothetical protein